MKHLGIIGAMEEEIRILTQAMTDKESKVIAGMQFESGRIDGVKATLVQSGVGKVNAALAAVCLIDTFSVDIVINTGSAGGIEEGLKIGDVVLSNRLAYHDADARVFGYEMGQVPQMPLYYEADKEMIEKIKKATVKAGMHPVIGEIVTGDSFVSSVPAIQRIKQHFPEALVTEMEGAAIAQVCWKMNKPFAVVRAVSDTADEEAGVTFDEFIVEAGKKSAEMVLHFIHSLKK